VSPPDKRKPRPEDGADADSKAYQPRKGYPRATTGSSDVDEVLRIARDYRRAARLVADDSTLSLRSKCLALIDLNRRARQELPAGFGEAAVWGGARHLFEADLGVPRSVIEANRRLLRRGHHDCPTCHRPLPDHDDLDRWEELGRRSMIARGAA
jgi:hypothetical protein